MKKIILSCLSVALLSGATKAQTTFGPEVGLNISNYSIVTPGGLTTGFISPVSSSVISAKFGGVVDFGISDNLSIQPGIFFALNGISQSYSFFGFSATENIHIHTLEIPVNVLYKFGDPGENRFFVGAGPFVGINLGGKVNLSSFGTDTTFTLNIGNGSSDMLKQFNFGAGVNGGYEMANGFLVRAFVQKGFVNMQSMDNSGGKIKSLNYGISVAYMIGGKKTKKADDKADDKKAGGKK